MTKTIFRLISSGVLAVLTGLWIFLAKSCPAFWFRFYPTLSRRLMTLLSGLTSALPIPVCEILALLAALWLIFTFVRALHRKRFVRWLSGLLLAAVLLVNLYVSVWGLNYFAPPVRAVYDRPAPRGDGIFPRACGRERAAAAAQRRRHAARRGLRRLRRLRSDLL